MTSTCPCMCLCTPTSCPHCTSVLVWSFLIRNFICDPPSRNRHSQPDSCLTGHGYLDRSAHDTLCIRWGLGGGYRGECMQSENQQFFVCFYMYCVLWWLWYQYEKFWVLCFYDEISTRSAVRSQHHAVVQENFAKKLQYICFQIIGSP